MATPNNHFIPYCSHWRCRCLKLYIHTPCTVEFFCGANHGYLHRGLLYSEQSFYLGDAYRTTFDSSYLSALLYPLDLFEIRDRSCSIWDLWDLSPCQCLSFPSEALGSIKRAMEKGPFYPLRYLYPYQTGSDIKHNLRQFWCHDLQPTFVSTGDGRIDLVFLPSYSPALLWYTYHYTCY